MAPTAICSITTSWRGNLSRGVQRRRLRVAGAFAAWLMLLKLALGEEVWRLAMLEDACMRAHFALLWPAPGDRGLGAQGREGGR